MSYLVGFFRDNLALKLFSLLVALLLWAFVMVRDNPPVSREFSVPVELRNVPAGLTVLSVSHDAARVTLSGLRRVVERANRRHFHLVGDLADKQIGEHAVPLQMLGVPGGLQVSSLQPPSVRVVLDKVVEQNRPVSVEPRGRPAEGYEAGAFEVRPAEVKLLGASSAIARVSRVVAEVDLSGLTGATEVQAAVRAVDDRGVAVVGLTVDPPRVTVFVPVTRVLTKTVPIAPRIGAPPPGYRVAAVRPNPATVTITGAPDRLAQTTEVASERIDLGGVTTQRTFNVGLSLPEGLQALGPASVSVTVQVVAEDTAEAEEEEAVEEEPEPPAEPGEADTVPSSTGAASAARPARAAPGAPAPRVPGAGPPSTRSTP